MPIKVSNLSSLEASPTSRPSAQQSPGKVFNLEPRTEQKEINEEEREADEDEPQEELHREIDEKEYFDKLRSLKETQVGPANLRTKRYWLSSTR